MKIIIVITISALLSFVSFSQAPGDNCASAAAITLPSIEGASVTTGLQSTSGLANDYSTGSYCISSSYGGGSDGVYVINVPANDYTYKFEYLNSGMNWKVLSINSGCVPTSGNCLGGIQTSSGKAGNVTLTLDAGVYYLFVDNWPTPNFGSFELKITLMDVPSLGEVCSLSQGFCSNVAYNFANTISSTPPAGPDYNMGSTCVSSLKPLVWYYMEVQQAGPMVMTLAQSTLPNGGGTGIDVDYVMWGPYPSLSVACTNIMSGDGPLQGSFSAASTETIAIGAAGGEGSCASTPALPSVGNVYVIGISNYGNAAGYITFNQTSGSGAANCNTITPCDISSVTASAGVCSGGVFDVTGSITFTDAPSTGTIIVTSTFGGSVSYPSSSTSPLAYTIPGVSGSGTGTVSVSFSTDNFCSLTSSSFSAPSCVTCTPISITSQSTNGQNACQNGTFTSISATVTGTNPTYKWYSNNSASNVGGTFIPSATNSSYTPLATTSGTLYYYCVVTGDCGSDTTSISGAFVVSPTTVGGTVSSNESICSGSSPSDLSLTGNVGSVTKWQKSTNTSFTGAVDIANTTTTLTGASIGNLTTTTYFRAVVQSGTCPIANSAYVTITIDPTSVGGTVSSDQSICSGSSPSDITLSGNVGNVTKWQSANNTSFTGAIDIANTTTTLTGVSIGNLTTTTYFRAEVQSGSCPVATSSYLTVTVSNNLTPSVSISSSDLDNIVCENSSVTFTPTPNNGGGSPTYQWYVNGILKGSSNSYTATLTDQDVVSCILHSNSGCLASNDVTSNTITTAVNPLPVISSLVSNTTICAGNTFTVNGTSSNATNYWSTLGSGTFNNSNALSTFYTPSVTDINAGTVGLYLHADGQGACLGQNISQRVDLTFNTANSPVVSLGNDTTICAVNAYTANGIASNGSIQWTSSGSGTFNNVAINNPIYTPSSLDTAAGSVKLKMIVTGATGVCNGFSKSDSLVVSFNKIDAPKIDAGSNATICAVSTYTTNGVKNLGTAQWTSSGTGTFTNGTSLAATYKPSNADTTAGSVKLYLTVTGTANQCLSKSAKDSLILTFNNVDAPKIDAGSNTTICAVSSYTTNGVKNLGTAQWTTSGTGSFTNGTTLTSIYTPSTSDTTVGSVKLYLTVTGTANQCLGQTAKDSLILTFNNVDAPKIDAGSNSTICAVSNFTTSGVKNLGTAQWTSSGSGTFANGTSLATTYKPSNADTTAGSVKLYLTVTGTSNQCLGQPAKDSLILTFNNVDAPKIDAGSNSTICAVSNFTTSGVKNLGTAQWTSSGSGTFTNGTSLAATYKPSNADTTAGSVKLYLTVTGTANQCLSKSAKDSLILTFNNVDAPKIDAGSNTTICAVSSYTTNGVKNLGTAQWTTSGTGSFTNGTTLTSIYAPSTSDTTAGSVKLYLTVTGTANQCLGQTAKDSLILTFNNVDAPKIDAGSNSTICAVSNFTTSGVKNLGTAQWTSSGSGTFANGTSLATTYKPSNADTTAGSVKLYLTVTGTSNQCLGQPAKDSLILTFNNVDAPKIDAGSNSTICAVSNFTTSGVKNLGTAQWTSSGTGTFTNGTSLAATYKPSNADTTAGSVKLYLTVTGTANQCLSKSAKDSLILTFNNVDAPKIDAGSNTTICAVSSYTTNGVKNLGTAQWTTSGTGSFTNGTTLTSIYTPSTSDTTVGSVKLYLTVTGTANQCLGQTAKDSLVLTFDKISVPKSYAGVNSSICAQTNYTASATATNANSIKWASNGTGTFQNDAIEDAIYVPSVSDVTVGQVTLTMQVKGGGNCISAQPTSSIVLTINKLPTAAIIGSSSICIGSNAPVVFTGTPNAIVSYNLNGGSNQTITLSNSGSASFMSNNVNADQTFNLVSVTNASTGCNLNTSSSINIIVVAYPLAPNVSNDSTYCEQDNIDLLTAQANGGGVLKWYSDAALTDSIGTGISFNPNYFTSSYYVTETNLIGCESLPSVINITVNKCEVKVPSAFTPDGDGVNDNWELEHLDLIYPKSVVKIFNRWGGIVFESTAGGYEKHPWDGKIKQDDLPVASYYYIIEYNDAKTESVKGIVTIIRK